MRHMPLRSSKDEYIYYIPPHSPFITQIYDGSDFYVIVPSHKNLSRDQWDKLVWTRLQNRLPREMVRQIWIEKGEIRTVSVWSVGSSVLSETNTVNIQYHVACVLSGSPGFARCSTAGRWTFKWVTIQTVWYVVQVVKESPSFYVRPGSGRLNRHIWRK